jgi:hypothetical protein
MNCIFPATILALIHVIEHQPVCSKPDLRRRVSTPVRCVEVYAGSVGVPVAESTTRTRSLPIGRLYWKVSMRIRSILPPNQ